MSSTPHPIGRGIAAPRIYRVATLPMILITIVVVTCLARLAFVFERLSPRYLPDEFLYSQLARSFASGHGVKVLGQPSPFPALLEPLATAAFWIPGNAEVAYRLTQSLHALAMSAAAVPIYLLAQRLGLSAQSRVAAVAVSMVAPGLVYMGYVTADALGYLLALGAILAAMRALETGAKWSQLWFLVLSAMAVSARAQYVVLIPSFLITAAVLERGRIHRAARKLPVVSGAVVLAGLGAVLAGPTILGRYRSVMSFGLSWDTGTWSAATLLLLTIGAGVVIVPGAAAWIGATLARPHDQAQVAFAAFVSTFVAGLILATAIVSVDTGSERFFERYLIVLVPLLALAFLAWIEEGRPARLVAAGIATAIVAVAAIVPLSGYAEGQGRADSPTLLAVSRLSESIGIGSASLAAALAITAAALITAATALSPRVPNAIPVGTALVFLVVLSIGAHAGDLLGSQRFQERSFVGSPRWVDATGTKNVLLVQTAYSGNALAMAASFWNTSVTGISRLGRHIDSLDGMGSPLLLKPDGALVQADGTPVDRPLLIATSGTAAAFSSDVRVVPDRAFALIVPQHPIRFVALAEGVRSDGTLAPMGRVVAYPARAGFCSTAIVRIAVPGNAPATTLQWSQSGTIRTFRVRPGATRTMSVTSLPDRGRTLEYKGWIGDSHGGRAFTASIALARFTAKTSRCAAEAKG